MAYADITVSSTSTSVICGVYSLQYPANQYDRIIIELDRKQNVGDSWSYVGQGDYNPPTISSTVQTHVFTSQQIQWYYRCRVYVFYGGSGTPYEFTSGTVQMPKQVQSAPSSAPTASSIDYSFIILNTITNGEYNINGGAAQNNIFTGLSSGVTYYFRQRYAETSTLQASPWSTSRAITTLDPVPDAPDYVALPVIIYDNTNFVVAWDSSSTSGVTYRLERSYNNSTYSFVTSTSNTYKLNENVGNNTQVRYRVRSEKDGYVSSWVYSDNETVVFTVGVPTNVTVSQPSGSLSVDVYYSWGTSATGMDIRWGTDAVNWNYFYDQSNNLYPSANYNIGVGSEGNKYFQVRSRRDYSGGTVYSSWVNATPYPINVTLARPSNWAWSYNISSGSDVYSVSGKNIYLMPATEWNNFTQRINGFRTYKGLSSYSFTAVSSDTDFTTTTINQALNAIRDMSAYFTGGNTLPTNRSSGDDILIASYYTRMRDCLNSIT